jgi:hypothetical protein
MWSRASRGRCGGSSGTTRRTRSTRVSSARASIAAIFGLKVFARLFHDIQDLPRHLGQHSGGMIVAQGRLDEVVPLEPASMPGRTIVQWDKEDCADLGIIKVDLLGLGMMAALEDTISILSNTTASRSTSRTCRPTTRRPTRMIRAPTPWASSRSRAAPRWRRCRG